MAFIIAGQFHQFSPTDIGKMFLLALICVSENQRFFSFQVKPGHSGVFLIRQMARGSNHVDCLLVIEADFTRQAYSFQVVGQRSTLFS